MFQLELILNMYYIIINLCPSLSYDPLSKSTLNMAHSSFRDSLNGMGHIEEIYQLVFLFPEVVIQNEYWIVLQCSVEVLL